MIAMRQQGCSKRWREVVAGGRVKEAEGPKGGKDIRLPPDREGCLAEAFRESRGRETSSDGATM